MTVTGRIYILVSLVVDIQAQQPVGYLGCFCHDCLVNKVQIYGRGHGSNNGELCRAGCKDRNKRYAGTWGYYCYCGSHILQNRKRNSAECILSCPGRTREKCACISSPCQNGATCTDINADFYICSCSVGWSGLICNEFRTTTFKTPLATSHTSSTQATSVIQTAVNGSTSPSSTQATSVIQTAVKDETTSPSSTQATSVIQTAVNDETTSPSSTQATTVIQTALNGTISPSSTQVTSVIQTTVKDETTSPSSTQATSVKQTTFSAQSGMNQQLLYVWIPEAIVVVVAVLTAFLVLKRKLNKVNNDGGVADRTVPVAANEEIIDEYIIDPPNGQDRG